MLIKEYVAIVTCLEEETKRTIGLKEKGPENMERVLPCFGLKRAILSLVYSDIYIYVAARSIVATIPYKFARGIVALIISLMRISLDASLVSYRA